MRVCSCRANFYYSKRMRRAARHARASATRAMSSTIADETTGEDELIDGGIGVVVGGGGVATETETSAAFTVAPVTVDNVVANVADWIVD